MPYFPESVSISADAQQLAVAQNQFGFTLLNGIRKQLPEAKNFVFSPYSVAVALTILLDATQGPAHEALAQLLGVADWDTETVSRALAEQLNFLDDDQYGNAVLRLANSLWTDTAFPVRPEFVAHIQDRYLAHANTLEMDAPEAAEIINAWVSHQTRGRVEQIVNTQNLNGPPMASAVLINVVYFKGMWERQFSPSHTKSDAFQLPDGDWVPRQFMHCTSTRFSYQRGPNWTAVRLPYEGNHRMHMSFFVPDTATGLPDFVSALTVEKWQNWQQNFREAIGRHEVALALPKFEVAWGRNLIEYLESMGLQEVMKPTADFTPMGFAKETGGFVGGLVHQAYLKLDEEGTEAAAVTAVMMMEGARMPDPVPLVEMRVERPFFCAITDATSGAVLFSGTIYDPA